MRLELEIHEGKLLIELIHEAEQPGQKEDVLAEGSIEIKAIFDEMDRINREETSK